MEGSRRYCAVLSFDEAVPKDEDAAGVGGAGNGNGGVSPGAGDDEGDEADEDLQQAGPVSIGGAFKSLPGGHLVPGKDTGREIERESGFCYP